MALMTCSTCAIYGDSIEPTHMALSTCSIGAIYSDSIEPTHMALSTCPTGAIYGDSIEQWAACLGNESWPNNDLGSVAILANHCAIEAQH